MKTTSLLILGLTAATSVVGQSTTLVLTGSATSTTTIVLPAWPTTWSPGTPSPNAPTPYSPSSTSSTSTTTVYTTVPLPYPTSGGYSGWGTTTGAASGASGAYPTTTTPAVVPTAGAEALLGSLDQTAMGGMVAFAVLGLLAM